MPHPRYSAEEIVRQGEEIYQRDLRTKVEPGHRGEFLVVDIDTGDYEIDRDEVVALDRAMARNPDGARYILRIGYPAVHKLRRHGCSKVV